MRLTKGSVISLSAEKKCYPNADSIGKGLEEQYTKEVLSLVIKKLEALNYKAIDCTAWDKEFYCIGDSLKYLVKAINNTSSALHMVVSLSISKKKLVECWVRNYGKAFKFAEKISSEIKDLGYYNTEVKIGENYLLDNNKSPTIIIKCYINEFENGVEGEFLNSIATAIVKAITN